MGTKLRRILIIFIVSIVAFCLAVFFLIYNGVILLNNPSLNEYPVRGVDVSSYQGEINWYILSEENISFAFIKATEGSSHQDKYLKNNLEEQAFLVLKPMPSPIDKIQNRFRWRIIIKGNMTEAANMIINNCLQNIYDANYKNTRVSVDVNPNSMI